MKTKLQTFDPHVMVGWPQPPHIPETPMAAFMAAAPFEDPEEDALTKHIKIEGIRTAMDCALDDRERWVIESIFYRKRGIRLLAVELNLSKTHIARIRDVAFGKLRTWMEENPDDTAGDAE